MKKKILLYLKHLVITLVIGGLLLFAIGLLQGTSINYDRNDLVRNLDNEGPYVFFNSDTTLTVNYIKGNDEKGYRVEQNQISFVKQELTCHYTLDSSSFSFKLNSKFDTPPAEYKTNAPILAISDIESNYATFRNFLINAKVINENLDWTFSNGHLVLVGDFIDRSYFSTQVLWFIYKLEQDAKAKGGQVHFILGNHEIMNMQGNHQYAKSKYNIVSAILGKKQYEIYDQNSFLGRWLQSKNTIELINDYLFIHGGLHPDMANIDMDITEINQYLRENYYQPYYIKQGLSNQEKLLHSSKTSPYWYRGYFKEKLSLAEIRKPLDKFKAKTVVVGHTVQSRISTHHQGLILAIDVKHPKDYYKYWPKRHSEGLLIDGNYLFRVKANGDRDKI